MKRVSDWTMEGGGGRTSRVDRATAHRWNRALLSIYYYGRRHQAPLSRHPPPAQVLPLEAAIQVVVGSRALGVLRLALADLCRTRAAQPSTRIEVLMRELVAAYGRLVGAPGWAAPDIVETFERIFRDDATPDPEEAYQQAIRRMKELESGTVLQLISFTVQTAS